MCGLLQTFGGSIEMRTQGNETYTKRIRNVYEKSCEYPSLWNSQVVLHCFNFTVASTKCDGNKCMLLFDILIRALKYPDLTFWIASVFCWRIFSLLLCLASIWVDVDHGYLNTERMIGQDDSIQQARGFPAGASLLGYVWIQETSSKYKSVQINNWLVVWNMAFIFHSWDDDPVWRTHIFQRDWNHQLDKHQTFLLLSLAWGWFHHFKLPSIFGSAPGSITGGRWCVVQSAAGSLSSHAGCPSSRWGNGPAPWAGH